MDEKMKINIFVILVLVSIFTGCATDDEVKELQEKISSLESSLVEKEKELDSYKNPDKYLDQYQKIVKKYILSSMNDPDSYKSAEWIRLNVKSKAFPEAIFITHKYRGKNSYGGVITSSTTFSIMNGKVQYSWNADVESSLKKLLSDESAEIRNYFIEQGIVRANLLVDFNNSFTRKKEKQRLLKFISSQGEYRRYLSYLSSSYNANEYISLITIMTYFPEVIEKQLYN